MKRVGRVAILTFVLLAGCAQQSSSLPSSVVAPAHATVTSVGHNAGFQTLYSFLGGADGTFPETTLVAAGGVLYGTTTYSGNTKSGPDSHSGGTLFRFDPSRGLVTLHRFPYPQFTSSAPTTLANLNGVLFGASPAGGTGSCEYNNGSIPCGAILRLDTTGSVAVVHNFMQAVFNTALIPGKNVLYGARVTAKGGQVYSLSPAGATRTIHDFPSQSVPTGLTLVGSTFYGTTDSHNGSVFSLSTTGTGHPIYSFKGLPTDGSGPSGTMVDIGGTLYGTTNVGGTGPCTTVFTHPQLIGCGTIFSISPDGTERVLYNFTGGADGSFPMSGLINVSGTLYGIASGSLPEAPGAYGVTPASIFSVTPSGTFTVLYTFELGPKGATPYAGLTYLNGYLYGTTATGGAHRQGTIFRFKL
jgi:uncharacterized repeat protein (TIGR03803 family)